MSVKEEGNGDHRKKPRIFKHVHHDYGHYKGKKNTRENHNSNFNIEGTQIPTTCCLINWADILYAYIYIGSELIKEGYWSNTSQKL